MTQNSFDDKSTLVQVMAWCHQATSHYLSQCWPRFMLPYGVPRPQWVNTTYAFNDIKFKFVIDIYMHQMKNNTECNILHSHYHVCCWPGNQQTRYWPALLRYQNLYIYLYFALKTQYICILLYHHHICSYSHSFICPVCNQKCIW